MEKIAVLTFLFAGIVFSSVNLWAEAAPSAAMEPVKKIVTMEKVNGTVAYIDGSAISVLYDQRGDAEYEIYLPIGADVQLDLYKKVSDIQKGDLVDLHYEKVVEAQGEPEERMTKTIKKIRFLKRPDKDALVSKE